MECGTGPSSFPMHLMTKRRSNANQRGSVVRTASTRATGGGRSSLAQVRRSLVGGSSGAPIAPRQLGEPRPDRIPRERPERPERTRSCTAMRSRSLTGGDGTRRPSGFVKGIESSLRKVSLKRPHFEQEADDAENRRRSITELEQMLSSAREKRWTWRELLTGAVLWLPSAFQSFAARGYVFDHASSFIYQWELLLVIATLYSTYYLPLRTVFPEATWDGAREFESVIDAAFLVDCACCCQPSLPPPPPSPHIARARARMPRCIARTLIARAPPPPRAARVPRR